MRVRNVSSIDFLIKFTPKNGLYRASTRMKEGLIQPERVKAIHEALCGFLLDEVINPNGEFYTDHRVSVGQLDSNRDPNEGS